MKHLSRFAKSVSFSTRGIAKAWREEPNFRLEIIAALAVILLAGLLRIDAGDLALIIFCCAIVLALELVNTMIEAISDMLKPRLNQYVKDIKDLTAAAVAIAALGSLGVAACLLVPPMIAFFWR